VEESAGLTDVEIEYRATRTLAFHTWCLLLRDDLPDVVWRDDRVCHGSVHFVRLALADGDHELWS